MKNTVLIAILIGVMLLLLSACSGIRGEIFAEPGDEDPPRLRYDGYYYTTDIGPIRGMIGTIIEVIVLWEDGTAAKFIAGRVLGDYHQYPLEYGALEEAHERAQEKIPDLIGSFEEAHWGNFHIEDDTIRVRVLVPTGNSSFYNSSIVEYKGEIQPDASFVITSSTTLPKAHQPHSRTLTYNFQPFDEIPSSDNWTHRLWKKE